MARFAIRRILAMIVVLFVISVITFLILEPRGLNRIWSRMKDYVRFWPFRY